MVVDVAASEVVLAQKLTGALADFRAEKLLGQGVVEHARQIGTDVLGPGLEALADKHDVIGEVRGTGVFWAVELVADRGSREPLAAADMGRLKGDLTQAGLLPFIADNRLHVVPPAVVTADEVAQGLEIIDGALSRL